jgi:hypothetical protein
MSFATACNSTATAFNSIATAGSCIIGLQQHGRTYSSQRCCSSACLFYQLSGKDVREDV